MLNANCESLTSASVECDAVTGNGNGRDNGKHQCQHRKFARNLLGSNYLPVSVLNIDSSALVADQSADTAIITRSLQLPEGIKGSGCVV